MTKGIKIDSLAAADKLPKQLRQKNKLFYGDEIWEKAAPSLSAGVKMHLKHKQTFSVSTLISA
jgi:hypothetical protein